MLARSFAYIFWYYLFLIFGTCPCNGAVPDVAYSYPNLLRSGAKASTLSLPHCSMQSCFSAALVFYRILVRLERIHNVVTSRLPTTEERSPPFCLPTKLYPHSYKLYKSIPKTTVLSIVASVQKVHCPRDRQAGSSGKLYCYTPQHTIILHGPS